MRLILIVLIVLGSFGLAQAADYDLEIVYSYSPTDPAYIAGGFKVYAGGQEICATGVDNPTLCEARGMAPGEYSWEMSAVFADGVESPRSAAFMFTLPIPPPTGPQILELRLRD